jgi:hypothetical protein
MHVSARIDIKASSSEPIDLISDCLVPWLGILGSASALMMFSGARLSLGAHSTHRTPRIHRHKHVHLEVTAIGSATVTSRQ